jgi:hypothetical protein
MLDKDVSIYTQKFLGVVMLLVGRKIERDR